jgi:hypothetical protein
MRRCKMEKLQPERVVDMLRQSGMEVTVEQARLILEFLRKLADMAVTQYLIDENSRFVYPGKHG